jgi:hypothetical protein
VEQTLEAEIAEPILGSSDCETVMLDLDDVSFKSARYWAEKAMEKFGLGGYVILRSSVKHYHVVFDCSVSTLKTHSVMAWVAILSKSVPLLRYLAMQCIKENSTLRVAPKGDKPSPRIVYRYGCQEHAVKDFLRHRRLVKSIYRSVHEEKRGDSHGR